MTFKGRMQLLCGAAAVVLAGAGVAQAADRAEFNIPPQALDTALRAFGVQSGHAVFAETDLTGAKTTRGFSAAADPETALRRLLEGTGLSYKRDGEMFVLTRGAVRTVRVAVAANAAPASADSASDGSAGDSNTVQELVVTAQKKSENIQVVPIAISAFTQQDLTTRQVAGGPDLMTQVPNMTFTKTNFSGYSIQIRGIGTQAISATTDAAVAVAFNNTPFIRNRFFEQEFYDLERVEVLRGPQGTLYGRNATAGVVNILSAKPTFQYDAKASADVANYTSRRLEGMINMPLVDDKVALRLAGAWTKRDGYDINQITGNPIDGRDLWSTRLSLRFAPSDRVEANLIWEHFQENDDRLRSGKQLCKTDEITSVAGIPTTHYQLLGDTGQFPGLLFGGVQGTFSQGCTPNSLYAPDSFETPNGIALPYYIPLGAAFLPTALTDPYVSRFQSHDLRVIESTVDPIYRAKSDLAEVQLRFDLTDSLTLNSETSYSADTLFSLEDYNRFNTAPGAWQQTDGNRAGVLTPGPNGGVFCDPQLGCTDRLVAVDLSTAKSRQFSQEFRLSSDYGGKFNFSLGANFLRYDTEDKYYVFINSISLITALSPFGGERPPYVGGVTDNSECLSHGPIPPNPNVGQQILYCTYIDPNPIGSLNDQGHNYFLSRNPYKLISYAAFGEAYYNLTDTLKLTGGLRWTVDRKEAPLIPSWLLASNSIGYPVAEVIRQSWSEPTGRLAIDWRPDLGFTEQTLLYASYAHGYKAGGANPPRYGVALWFENGSIPQTIIADSVTHPKTFGPEFVNAFEIGSKNTLLDGKLTVNADAFYYDYTGYQISQIIDRSASNLNFDATVWGFELETDWRPLKNLRLGFKGGYEHTRVADGMKAVDIMDRTAGHTDWVVVRPFPSIPSNCILPAWLFIGNTTANPANPELVNIGGRNGGNPGGCEVAYILGKDPVTGQDYVPYPTNVPFTHTAPINYAAWDPSTTFGTSYPGWDPKTAPNHGEGFDKDLSGNELPNAPHFTATITADYTIPLPNDWLATLHTDLYYQSEAWTRIFNMPGYDRLKAYSNINVAAIFSNETAGWRVMAYVKNVLDRDSITGAFLNSDDSGLTTNVFLTEPRLYGLRVTKDWTGVGPWWTGASSDHKLGEPYPLTVELGGQVQRHHAPYETVEPSFIDKFSDTLNVAGAPQHRDLDWGDGRDVKLTYRPESGPWTVSADVRFGRTNGGEAKAQAEELTEPVCRRGGYYTYLCSSSTRFSSARNTSDSSASNREEHQFVDFAVSRDVGVGGLDRSSLGLGLRYAQFKSITDIHMAGVPDWYLPTGFIDNPYVAAHHHRYVATLEADREFKGAGPILSWDASRRLLGNDEVGHIDADWSLSAGALFGKHRTSLTGTEANTYYEAFGFDILNSLQNNWIPPTATEPTKHVNTLRTKSVTVPLVDLSVGVSYEIQRIKLSTGYRWERYFNAVDAGFQEHKNFDRTIDGPYFKVSVGFGG